MSYPDYIIHHSQKAIKSLYKLKNRWRKKVTEVMMQPPSPSRHGMSEMKHPRGIGGDPLSSCLYRAHLIFSAEYEAGWPNKKDYRIEAK